MVSTKTLYRIALGGAFALITTKYVFERKIVNGLIEGEHYKLALQALQDHHGALNLLGEPILEKRIRLDNKENFCYDNNAHFQVPIEGSKKSGTFYYWAEKNNNIWKITRAELEFNDDVKRRLVVIRHFPSKTD